MKRLGFTKATASVVSILSMTGTALGQAVDVSGVTISRSKSGTSKVQPAFLSLEEVSTADLVAAVGHGYDPISQRILPDTCVDAVGQVGKLEPATDVTVSYTRVRNLRQNQSASETDVSVGALIKVVSLGFGHSDTAKNYFNSVDGFGRIKARIATKGVQLGKVTWAAGADPARSGFVGRCGTYFVRAVYSGHLLDDWVRFSLREDQKTTTEANALSVGVGQVFSASVGVGDAASRVNCYADTTFEHHGRGAFSLPPVAGGGGQPPANAVGERIAAKADDAPKAPEPDKPADPKPEPGPPKPPVPPNPSLPGKSGECGDVSGPSQLQVLIDYYNGGFKTAVTGASLDTAKPLYIIIDRYADPAVRLPRASLIPTWVDSLIETVTATSDDYYDLVNAISDMNYALESGPVGRIGAFYDVAEETDNTTTPPTRTSPEDVVKRKRTAALAMLDSYKVAVERCRDLALGPQNPPGGGSSATVQCSSALKTAIDAKRVDAVSIRRKFS